MKVTRECAAHCVAHLSKARQRDLAGIAGDGRLRFECEQQHVDGDKGVVVGTARRDMLSVAHACGCDAVIT